MKIPLSDTSGAFERALDRHQERQFDESNREDEEHQSVTVDWPAPCKACDCATDRCVSCFDVAEEEE